MVVSWYAEGKPRIQTVLNIGVSVLEISRKLR